MCCPPLHSTEYKAFRKMKSAAGIYRIKRIEKQTHECSDDVCGVE